MSTQIFSRAADIALAAYASDLASDASNTQAYKDAEVGMAPTQATTFDVEWDVLLQSPPNPDGFSGVLFANRLTGEKILGIAGTDKSSTADVLTDLVNIAVIGSVLGMPQYASLESFYSDLVSRGLLAADEQIVVAGHSLGGFLAQAFTARHESVVSAAYTFNAPGFGSIELALSFLGITSASAGTKITNYRASDGISVTAGLGTVLGSTQLVNIEPGSLAGKASVLSAGQPFTIYLNKALSSSQSLVHKVGDAIQSRLGSFLRCGGALVVIGSLCACERWELDRRMQQLCARDGGLKVEETVLLQEPEYTRVKEYLSRPRAYGAESSDYMLVTDIEILVGVDATAQNGRGQLRRISQSIHRKADGKLLSREITYDRSGGDGFTLGFQPSSSYCPKEAPGLITSTFRLQK